MKYLIPLSIILLLGCKKTDRYEPPKYIVMPPPPVEESKPRYYLVFSCSQQGRRFYSQSQALEFKKSMEELGLMTQYNAWRMQPFGPGGPDMLNPPFNYPRSDTPVYDVYYWTDGEVKKEVPSAEMQEVMKYRMRDLGCTVVTIVE